MINAIGQRMTAGQLAFAVLLMLGFVIGYFAVILACVDNHLFTWVRWLDGLDGVGLMLAMFYIMRKVHVLP